jgi:GNAT superfamily N-acetyltransferase
MEFSGLVECPVHSGPPNSPLSLDTPLTARENRRVTITYEWRGEFANAAVNALHAEGFDHPCLDIDWQAQVHEHSLGWVCARDGDRLAGFVNVAWDGGVHAFILDTMVDARDRHHGIGAGLIAFAAQHARASGCEWLHVDFEDHLTAFYFQACGFTPTNAGLIALPARS